jgi:thiamine-phosphate pyrophosphorylase
MPPIVLTFAASDPTGGAGLQADLLTLAALGCHPLSVVTGITVQDTRGVESLDAVDAALVERQAAKAARRNEGRGVQARRARLGGERSRRSPLSSRIIRAYRWCSIRCLASGRGDPLASDAVVDALLELIVPSATLANAEQHRGTAPGRRARPPRPRLSLRAADRHALRRRPMWSTPLRRERQGARGPLAATSRQLSRLGLHARFGLCGKPRARSGDGRRGARCTGIHLAVTLRGFSPGRRAIHSLAQVRGLYAITPEGPGLFEKVRAALEGGIALLQYRRKGGARAEAEAIARLAKEFRVPLIVNDDVELALAIGADGAHLGKDDGDFAAARKRLKGKILGASCYDRLELARKAVAAGADYVAFGSVFASPTKPGAVRAPLSLFRHDLGVPKCAIGGITLANAPEVIAAGADLLAVISDLFDAPDIAARARAYAKLFA